MKVKLIVDEIVNNVPTDEQLGDSSVLDGIYIIRKLKALTESQEVGFIVVDNVNENKQVYSEKYQIWFDVNEFNYMN